MLAELGNGQDFGDVAAKWLAERAVLRLLTSRASQPAGLASRVANHQSGGGVRRVAA